MSDTVKVNSELLRQTETLPRYIDNIVLGAATAETWTVPADIEYVRIVADAAVYFRVTGTAIVPNADVTDGTGCALIPANVPFTFRVAPTDAVSLIRASGQAIVSISAYSR